MLIAIQGFGSIWSCRPVRENVGVRFQPPAYYNTTGVLVGNKLRHRSCVYGYIRVDACTELAPHSAHRALHRVFECDGIQLSSGGKKLFLNRRISGYAVPESYLIRLAPAEVGWINRQRAWLCDTGEVLSSSDGNGLQEHLVVLPPFGWIRTSAGVFCLEPDAAQPGRAQLRQIRSDE